MIFQFSLDGYILKGKKVNNNWARAAFDVFKENNNYVEFPVLNIVLD